MKSQAVTPITKAQFMVSSVSSARVSFLGILLPQYRHLLCILIQSGPEDFMTNLAGVVQQLRKERDQAANEVKRLNAALSALNGASGKRTGTRSRLSAAARARIAAAQRARWAKLRGNGGQTAKTAQKPKVISMRKKKTMSAAARRKIAAAMKARWAKVRAGQKKG
jgi:hypothetical protein